MWGIFAIFIAFVIFWLYFKKLQDEQPKVSKGPFELSSKPQVATQDATKTLLSSTNTGTLLAYVYPLQGQKTGTMTLCNPSGSFNPGEPECSSGEYSLCTCIGNDCSKCIHSGYVNLLNVSNVIRLEMLVAPDASRQNAAGTQLVVRTTGMGRPVLANGQRDLSGAITQVIFEETLPLPNIPYQKWTYVAIAREGRRFDVYYNGKIVMSKRTQNVVDIRTAYAPIVAGDPNMRGTIALVESVPEKLTQASITEKYKATSDTTGEPILPLSVNLKDYIPDCKDGNCVTGPKMRPTSPLLDWQTEVA